MGQCRTLDADVTTVCYYGDYSSCDNTIPTSLFIWNNFFRSRLFASFFFKIKHVLDHDCQAAHMRKLSPHPLFHFNSFAIALLCSPT